MKLFQRLLVAPAALGLMAPVAVNADTAFSSTTTLGGSAVFTVGSMDDTVNSVSGAANEEIYMQYAYGLDLNSSFSGSDNLYVGVEAGNASEPLSLFLDSSVDVGAALTVTSLYYSFPLGDIAVTGGPLLDTDDVIAATTSTYSEGLVAQSLPFSAIDWTGAGIAAEYAPDNGIVASASFVSLDGANSSIGINSDNGNDVTTLSLGFNGDGGFGGGIVYSSSDGDGTTTVNNIAEYSTLGAGVYYNMEDMPLGVSVAFDSIENEDLNLDSTSWFIGVDYEVGPGTAHVAYQSLDVDGGTTLDTDGFEVGYSYDVNDNVTVMPAFFTLDIGNADTSGVVVETKFSF